MHPPVSSFFMLYPFIRGCGRAVRVSGFVCNPQGFLAMTVPTCEKPVNQRLGGIARNPAGK
jgi:hypothetical protein